MNPDYVPVNLRLNAIEYVKQAAAALGVGAVAIEWHASTPDIYQAKWYAWFMGNSDLKQLQNIIHICVDSCKNLTPSDLRWVIHHECRHYQQWLSSRHIGDDAEKDADEWACRTLGYTPSDKLLPYWSRK